MSSQDTMNNAQSEEESAKVIQGEIDKAQADIAELQNDINDKNQVISGLQENLLLLLLLFMLLFIHCLLAEPLCIFRMLLQILLEPANHLVLVVNIIL